MNSIGNIELNISFKKHLESICTQYTKDITHCAGRINSFYSSKESVSFLLDTNKYSWEKKLPRILLLQQEDTKIKQKT